MKLRSSLLIACMVIVPLLAMFSHKIPTQARAAAREHVWNPVQQAILSALDMESTAYPTTGSVTSLTAPPNVIPPSTGATPLAAQPLLPAAWPGDSGALADPPPTAAESPTPLERIDPVILEPVALPTQPPMPPPAPRGRQVAAALASATRGEWHKPAAPTSQATGSPRQATLASFGATTPLPDVRSAAGRQALEDRLRQLGALAFAWTPLTAGGGVHGCSCSMAVDTTGQLHRVFHGSGSDPTAAADNLLAQIDAWQRTRSPQHTAPERAALGPTAPPAPY
ncbi:MAG: hypothetical protein WCJ21_06840 [Planctomycetota bacterium]